MAAKALVQHSGGIAAGRYVGTHSAGVVRVFLCRAVGMAMGTWQLSRGRLQGFHPFPPLHHGYGHAEWTALFICSIVRGATARHSAFQGSVPLPALRILQAFIGSISMKQPVMQRPVAVHRRWLVQRRGPPPSRAAALLSHWREPVPCLLHPVPSRRF